MKILIAIPAYNEEGRISKLLKILTKKYKKQDILVIDDGSSDSTFEEAKAFGVNVIKNTPNLGKGESIKKAFQYALKNCYDAVITMDADLQHDPADLPKFIKKFNEGCDLVIGTRWHELYKMPFLNYLSNRLTTMVLSLLAGTRLPDTQSGYRLYSKRVLKLKFTQSRYDFESEVVFKIALAGFKVCGVPIKVIYGTGVSSVDKVRDTLRFIKLTLKFLWR